MKEIEISDWDHFEREVRTLEEHIRGKNEGLLPPQARPMFRGQGDAEWELTTTLERWNQPTMPVRKYDRWLRGIHPAVESNTGKTWPLDGEPNCDMGFREPPPNYGFMVYVRQLGFPSPLLDWTQSPYIALYFAFEKERRDEGNVAVWAYSEMPEGSKGGWGNFQIRAHGPYVTTHPRHFTQQAVYTFCVDAEDVNRPVWHFAPHKDVFKSSRDDQDLLRKFVLPSRLQVEFLERLHKMNINAFTLFGTEESLMTMLACKEILFRDAERKRRTAKNPPPSSAAPA